MKKNLHLLITAFMLFAFSTFCYAQEDYKEFMKERKEISKFTKEQLREKVSKSTQKEAKKLQKEGWKVAPGSLPLDKQLERAYQMQYEIDTDSASVLPRSLLLARLSMSAPTSVAILPANSIFARFIACILAAS